MYNVTVFNSWRDIQRHLRQMERSENAKIRTNYKGKFHGVYCCRLLNQTRRINATKPCDSWWPFNNRMKEKKKERLGPAARFLFSCWRTIERIAPKLLNRKAALDCSSLWRCLDNLRTKLHFCIIWTLRSLSHQRVFSHNSQNLNLNSNAFLSSTLSSMPRAKSNLYFYFFSFFSLAIKRPRTVSTAARQVSTAHERDLVTNQNV